MFIWAFKMVLKKIAKRNESRLMTQFRSSLCMEGGGFDVDEMNESNRESYAIINASMHNFESHTRTFTALKLMCS